MWKLGVGFDWCWWPGFDFFAPTTTSLKPFSSDRNTHAHGILTLHTVALRSCRSAAHSVPLWFLLFLSLFAKVTDANKAPAASPRASRRGAGGTKRTAIHHRHPPPTLYPIVIVIVIANTKPSPSSVAALTCPPWPWQPRSPWCRGGDRCGGRR